MIGVILAGGTGTRLKPLTNVTNKHLLHVYNRPMIDYPLSTILSTGTKNIKIVSGGEHLEAIYKYLGSGDNYNVRFSYYVQEQAGGIAQALSSIEEDVREGDKLMVILGDNIIEDNISKKVLKFENKSKGAHLFLKKIPKNRLYEMNKGVYRTKYAMAELDKVNRVINVVEKPIKPKTNYVVTGIYLFDNSVFDKIKRLKPSFRGEYEITDVIQQYINQSDINSSFLNGYWLDAGGSIDDLVDDSVKLRKRPPKTIKILK